MALKTIGRPAILKGAAFGYDGKGQQRINQEVDLDAIWTGRADEVCVLERVIDFREGDFGHRRAWSGWSDGGLSS